MPLVTIDWTKGATISPNTMEEILTARENGNVTASAVAAAAAVAMVCSCGNGGGGAISAALFSLFVAARPILLSWQGVVVRMVAVLVLVLVVAVNATLVSSNNKASHNMVAPKPKRNLMLIVR